MKAINTTHANECNCHYCQDDEVKTSSISNYASSINTVFMINNNNTIILYSALKDTKGTLDGKNGNTKNHYNINKANRWLYEDKKQKKNIRNQHRRLKADLNRHFFNCRSSSHSLLARYTHQWDIIICSSSTSPGYITTYATPQAVVKMDVTSLCFIRPSTVAPRRIMTTAARTTTPQLLEAVPQKGDMM